MKEEEKHEAHEGHEGKRNNHEAREGHEGKRNNHDVPLEDKKCMKVMRNHESGEHPFALNERL
jgi:hypothetical protein